MQHGRGNGGGDAGRLGEHKTLLRVLLLSLLMCAPVSDSHAASPRHWALTAGPGLSFTSYHFTLSGTYRQSNNEFSIGPRFTTDDYLPYTQPYGGQAGWRHRLGGRRLISFLGAEYQFTAFKPFGRNWVHEVFWTYGVELPITQGFSIGNSLGYGLSIESYRRPGGRDGKLFVAPDGLLKLYAQYAMPIGPAPTGPPR